VISGDDEKSGSSGWIGGGGGGGGGGMSRNAVALSTFTELHGDYPFWSLNILESYYFIGGSRRLLNIVNFFFRIPCQYT